MSFSKIFEKKGKFLLIFSLFFASSLAQAAAASVEQIENYDVEIEILNDSNIYVTESIEYNFGNNQKHGIYRDIPVLQKNYKQNPFKISDIKVTDANGQAYKTKISKGVADVNIKIGDADKYVTGIKTYVISYKVEGAFLFAADSDNLFWNAIGTEWDVAILKNNITVYLPEALAEQQFEDKCYFGIRGSTTECPGAFYVASSNNNDRVEQIVFKTKSLTAKQGVTVNLYFHKGTINQPPPPNAIIAWLKQFGFFFPPIITFIFMLYWWATRGRDPKGRGTIVAQYEPPEDMMPAEMGVLQDETVDRHDFSAEIIYLAIQGYIKIKRIESKTFLSKKEDFLLEKLKDSNSLTREYQKDLLENLFSKPLSLQKYADLEVSPEAMAVVKISDLKKDAYKWFKKVNKKIYQSTTEKGYFDGDPKKIKAKYSLAFILVFIVFVILQSGGMGIAGYFGLNNILGIMWGMSFASIGLIIGVFGMAMPKRSLQGALAKEHILGLKEYINVAEKDRINFHNDPSLDPAFFEKLLPYAMVFKLEKKWAKKFEGIYLEEPSWYDSGQGSSFSAIALGSSLSDFSTSSANAMTPASSGGGASGGGFSGGGGGGGGGGSW